MTVRELARRRRMSAGRMLDLLRSFPPGVVEEVTPGRWGLTPAWRAKLREFGAMDVES